MKFQRYYRQPFIVMMTMILMSFSLSRAVQAADPPLSLDSYWQKIEETQTLVASMDDASLEASQAQLHAAADQWAQVTAVTLPDGARAPVDPSFLVARLRADPPDLVQLNGLLTTLLAARQRWPEQLFTTSDIDALQDILARPEFAWQPKPRSPLAELWEKLQQFLWEFIGRLLGSRVIDANNTWLSYLFTALGLLALIFILAYMFRGVLLDFVAEAEIEPDSQTGLEALTAEAALKQAQTLSSAGDYRAAVRYLYLSSLLVLEERGLLRYDRARTNREYLRSVAHLPQLATILREVIEVFDRVWYGYEPLDQVAYAHYATRVADLHRQK